MLSPSRQPKDPASPSSARKTSWSPANSETKTTSISRFSLTKESKLSICSGGWCNPPIDGICSLIVLLLTYFLSGGGGMKVATSVPLPTSKSYPLSVRSACHRLFSSHVLEHF